MEEQELLSGREIGRRAAERVARAIPRRAQFTRSLMVVTRVVDGWHYDVDGGTKDAPATISGVPATSAAVNAKVGDVLVVDVYNSKALAIGILPSKWTLPMSDLWPGDETFPH